MHDQPPSHPSFDADDGALTRVQQQALVDSTAHALADLQALVPGLDAAVANTVSELAAFHDARIGLVAALHAARGRLLASQGATQPEPVDAALAFEVPAASDPAAIHFPTMTPKRQPER